MQVAPLKTAIYGAFGGFLGIAGYSYLISNPHKSDWMRAAFISAISFLALWLFFSISNKLKSKPNA